jgi:hypothetical protein
MKRDGSQAGYRLEPSSNTRRQQIDWLDLMRRQHTIHALLEVDVTGARQSTPSCSRTSVIACTPHCAPAGPGSFPLWQTPLWWS